MHLLVSLMHLCSVRVGGTVLMPKKEKHGNDVHENGYQVAKANSRNLRIWQWQGPKL